MPDAAGNDLPHLDHPDAVDRYGVVTVTLDRPDISAASNLIENGAFDFWLGDSMSSWRTVAGGSVSREVGSRHGVGIASALVDAPAAGDGIEQEAFAEPTVDNPRVMGIFRVVVVRGTARLSLIAGDTEIAAFELDPDAQPRTVVLAPPNDYEGRGLFSVRLAAAAADTLFVAQAAGLLNTLEPPRTFIEGRIGNRLWGIATDYLTQFHGPLDELQAGIIDRHRVDPVNVPFGAIQLGALARLTDAGAGLDVERRIVAVTRNYVIPGDTSVQLESQRQTLVGVIGRRVRPEWSVLDPNLIIDAVDNALAQPFRIVSLPNRIWEAGQPITPIVVSYADARAGGTVTATLTVAPALAGIALSGDVISGTPPDTAEGVHTLTVEASDGLTTAEEAFTALVVQPPPLPDPADLTGTLELVAPDVTAQVSDGSLAFSIGAAGAQGRVAWSISGEPDFIGTGTPGGIRRVHLR